MPGSLINLTLPIVITEIERILDGYPYHPYQQAFAIPDLRQRLLAYVLNHIQTFYCLQEESQETFLQTEERSQMTAAIHQGINEVLQEQSDWVNHHIPQDCSVSEPSHWFG